MRIWSMRKTKIRGINSNKRFCRHPIGSMHASAVRIAFFHRLFKELTIIASEESNPLVEFAASVVAVHHGHEIA